MSLSWRRRTTGDSKLGKKSGTNNKSSFKVTGNGLTTHQYSPGDEQRVVIPLLPNKNGDLRPLMLAVPIHRVNNNNKSLEFPKKDGSTFKGYQVRSNHPFSNSSLGLYEDAKTIAEHGEVCVIHELIELQRMKAWKGAHEKFGEDLKALSDDEKRELGEFMSNQESGYYFQPTYYAEQTTRDGEVIPARTMDDAVIVMLQYETETTIEKKANGIERPVEKVVLDEDGQPKYRPILFTISGPRSQKIQEAIDDAIDLGTLSVDDLHPYTEFEGTEDEVQTVIGWVDLTFKWPKGTKLESGRNLSVLALPSAQKIVTPEMIEKYSGEEGTKLVESAERMFFGRPSNKLRTRQEQLDVLTTEALRTYEELSEEFEEELTELRERFAENVFSRFNDDKVDTSEDNDDESTEESEEPKAEPKKTASKTKAKKDDSKDEDESKSKANIQDLLDMVKK